MTKRLNSTNPLLERFDGYWLAVRTAMFLCRLPFLLRLYTLPGLLQRLSPLESSPRFQSEENRTRTVHVVRRVCGLRPFRTRLFPKACLLQSLALYYVLGQKGYPVSIHLGVRKENERLQAHSWITLGNTAFTDSGRTGRYRPLYSYGCITNTTGHNADSMILGDSLTSLLKESRDTEDAWNLSGDETVVLAKI